MVFIILPFIRGNNKAATAGINISRRVSIELNCANPAFAGTSYANQQMYNWKNSIFQITKNPTSNQLSEKHFPKIYQQYDYDTNDHSKNIKTGCARLQTAGQVAQLFNQFTDTINEQINDEKLKYLIKEIR